MRLLRVGVVALLLLSCTTQAPAPAPTPSQRSQAADLRTRMNLLMGEDLLLIAKVSSAAVNHSDEYTSYPTVLAANADDLTNLMRSAFGNTAGDEFRTDWAEQNANYVDYAIGVVTHNQDRANAAVTRLTSDSSTKLSELFSALLHRPPSELIEQLHNQVTAMKEAIDDQFAQNYKLVYAEIHVAYDMAGGLGDLLAQLIAKAFPDKFPGGMSGPGVTDRVVTNHLLLERAYVLTMATDAITNGRTADAQEALSALVTNASTIGRFNDAWAQQATDVAAYASKGDEATRRALTRDFVAQLSAAARVGSNLVADQTGAIVQVIDDQRAKKLDVVAGDDRAAATAMQPIADAMTA